MPNGKCSDQNQHLFPFGKLVHRAKGEDEKNMVKALNIRDMVETKAEVGEELAHLAD